MTTQAIASVVRQVVAVVSMLFGILTAAVSAIHLPPAVSTIMVAVGGAIMGIEHFVGDPSTGKSTVPPQTPPQTSA